MPTVTTAVEAGYAHCTNPRCPGHDQVQVQIVKTETSFTYAENGGNFPGIERSYVLVTFADESEATCRYCHGHREATDQPRKQYASLSGHDPRGLLQVARFDPDLQRERMTAPVSDAERSEFQAEREQMQRQMLEMQQQMADLLDAVRGKATDPPVLNGLENVVNTAGTLGGLPSEDPIMADEARYGASQREADAIRNVAESTTSPKEYTQEDTEAHRRAQDELAARIAKQAERLGVDAALLGGEPEPFEDGPGDEPGPAGGETVDVESATAALENMTPEERAAIEQALSNLRDQV